MSAGTGDQRISLGSVRVTGEFLMAPSHVSPMEIEFGFVRKSVFNGVVVEILVDFVTAVMSPPLSLAFDGPHALHPAAFVDVMNKEIAE